MPTDMIRGVARDEPTEDENRVLPQTPGSLPTPRRRKRDAHLAAAHKVVVVSEHDFVVVGVDARDRPGLLLDISKGLSRLRLNLRHTEASVVGSRSLSIWRCELVDIADLPDLEEIWSVLNVSSLILYFIRFEGYKSGVCGLTIYVFIAMPGFVGD